MKTLTMAAALMLACGAAHAQSWRCQGEDGISQCIANNRCTPVCANGTIPMPIDSDNFPFGVNNTAIGPIPMNGAPSLSPFGGALAQTGAANVALGVPHMPPDTGFDNRITGQELIDRDRQPAPPQHEDDQPKEP